MIVFKFIPSSQIKLYLFRGRIRHIYFYRPHISISPSLFLWVNLSTCNHYNSNASNSSQSFHDILCRFSVLISTSPTHQHLTPCASHALDSSGKNSISFNMPDPERNPSNHHTVKKTFPPNHTILGYVLPIPQYHILLFHH